MSSIHKHLLKLKGSPAALIILDGWGIGPDDYSNAIKIAKTPNYDSYVKNYPMSRLKASAEYVGLPKHQDGNSEAGHMNIGAGRIVEQDSVVISRSISDGTFFKNPALLQAARHAMKNNSSVHLMGLLSNGQSAHSHPDHLIALLTYFKHKGVKEIFLHIFTDGRDSHRYEGIKLLRKYHQVLYSNAKIATIIGRVYAMDRKKDWNHTKVAYEAMVMGKAKKYASSAENAVVNAYNRGETDEFVTPTVITKNDKPIGRINNSDSVVFFNLRSDRARQMSKPFSQQRFEQVNRGSFKRSKVLKNIFFTALSDFGPDLDELFTAYPSRDIVDTLPTALKKFKQLYVAESEKYAHVTYFFNGGYDSPIVGEDRILVPSPDVLSYIKHPRMSLDAVAKIVIQSVQTGQYQFVCANFSNADMLAHTGSLNATIAAIECIDENLGLVVEAVLKKNGTVFITADHGNAEELINRDSGEIDTEHSKSLVPFIAIRKNLRTKFKDKGILADVAPTILSLLKAPIPKLMTGKSLIKK